VSEKHILAVANEYVCRVDLGGRRRTDSDDIPMIMVVAKLLWSANVRSINARYNTTHRRGRINAKNINSAIYSVDAILKLIDCLDYQSCEFDGWDRCKAKAMLTLLEYDLVYSGAASRDSLDYNNAEWCI